ncbi:MAG TPA: helix-turn-helix transcriptional regulator, partial [Acholeplasma sp.]|nr:helix-turn-helix transcriptional regulator [Acholeplasma sp.]
ISHQLRVLKDINLVKYERSGKNIIYSLSDNHVYEIFNQAIEHVCEEGNNNA